LFSLHATFALADQVSDAKQRLTESAPRIALGLGNDAVLDLLLAQSGAISGNIDQAMYEATSEGSDVVSIRSGKCTVRAELNEVDTVQEGRNPFNVLTVNEQSLRIACAK
jgi:hypothetical protein